MTTRDSLDRITGHHDNPGYRAPARLPAIRRARQLRNLAGGDCPSRRLESAVTRFTLAPAPQLQPGRPSSSSLLPSRNLQAGHPARRPLPRVRSVLGRVSEAGNARDAAHPRPGLARLETAGQHVVWVGALVPAEQWSRTINRLVSMHEEPIHLRLQLAALSTPPVTVLFAGQQIPKSPFVVGVDKALGDASKVTAKGAGLEPTGNIANRATYFDVYTAGAGVGDVTLAVKDPQGRENSVEVMMEDRGDATYRCTYRPTQPGPHAIAVSFAGAAIPRSPFTVDIGPASVAGACRTSGRGLQPSGVRVRQVADFRVDTRKAGSGDLKVIVKGPSEYGLLDILGDASLLLVLLGAAQYNQSPTGHLVEAFGPGLEKTGCIVNQLAEFTVNAKDAGKGPLAITAQ
ncbi:LOW QUALITY PROTEIN: hypothetical protein CRUP_011722, partial [Coryphaenoides rupestris]